MTQPATSSREDILYYLEAAMEGNDPRHIARAIGDVARSKGMSEIARTSGFGRQALFTAHCRTTVIRPLKPW